MKKKILAVLAAILVAIPMLTVSVSRVTPRWSLINSATALCIMDGDYYYASVIAGDDVTRLDMDVILYEKGLLTSYSEVSSIHRTVYSYYKTLSCDYTFSSSKDYKVELTVTAHTADGQTETVVITKEYT